MAYAEGRLPVFIDGILVTDFIEGVEIITEQVKYDTRYNHRLIEITTTGGAQPLIDYLQSVLKKTHEEK